MKTKTLAIAVMMSVAAGVSAETWWVQKDGGVDADGRGTESAPFRTIQHAVDKAKAGDTIKVLPGVYDEGGKVNVNSSIEHTNRVAIVDKALTLESTGGATATHIVGGGEIGDSGIRCVFVQGTGPVVVKGFTLREGHGGLTATHRAGGFLQMHGRSDAYLIDCVVSNCTAATGGGMRGGTAIRCWFTNNRCPTAEEASSVNGGVGLDVRFWNCLLECNPVPGGVNSFESCTFVNCTLFGNGGYAGVGGGCALYNSIVTANGRGSADSHNIRDTSIRTAAVANGCVIDAAKPNVAPALGDFRVIAGGPADGTCDPACLTDGTIALPSGTEITDFTGRIIDTSANICAGCIQDTAPIVAGGVILRHNGTVGSTWNGKRVPVPGAYAYATEYPVQWHIEMDGVSIGSATTYVGKVYRTMGPDFFPDTKNMMDLMPPPVPGLLVTNTVDYWKAVWADASAPDGGDGTEAHPYNVLQDAVVAAGSATVIFVKPGVYDKGGKSGLGSPYYGTSRVSFNSSNLRMVSTDGAERTIIMGSPDPDTGGLGPGACRCVQQNASPVAVQGFTLTGGYTYNESAQQGFGAASRGGGVHLWECIITNNHAYSGVVYQGPMFRCVVDDNTSPSGSLVEGGNIVSCWFGPGNRSNGDNNTSYYGYLSSSTWAYNDTMLSTNGATLFSQNAKSVFNCIGVGGKYIIGSMNQKGNLFWQFKSVYDAARGKFTDADPMLAPDGVHPYTRISPVFSAAATPTAEDWDFQSYSSNYWMYAAADIDGNLLRFDAEGRPVAGCAQTVDPCLFVPTNGVLTAAGGQVGLTRAADVGSVTIGLAAGQARPCAGYVVNGTVTNGFDGAAAITAADVVAAGGMYIEPLLTGDWYVDAVNGSDANSGFTPGMAKRTLADMMTNTTVTAGDTVHALPGVYSQGEMIGGDAANTLASRVVVPEGVTLVGDAGAAETVIEGAASPDAAWEGCGPGAVRCVLLDCGTARLMTKIKGFTLRGGRTEYPSPEEDWHKHYTPDYSGGGVTGMADYYVGNTVVEDCVITNCAAYRSGGVRYVHAIRCRFEGNRVSSYGAAAGESRMAGCFTRGNTGASDNASRPGEYAVSSAYSLTDCTILDGFNSFQLQSAVGTEGDIGARNCIIAGWLADNMSNRCYRCAFASEKMRFAETQELKDGSFVVAEAELGLDAEGRPIGGASPVCDIANVAYSADAGIGDDAADLSGFQRVMNGARDIGALEGDWRGRYAEDLGGGTLAVKSASPDVIETAGRAVRIGSGTLEAEIPNSSGRSRLYELEFSVDGDGTLAVTAGGETTSYTAGGPYRLSLRNDWALNGFTFSCTTASGVGGATLTSVTARRGMAIYMR